MEGVAKDTNLAIWEMTFIIDLKRRVVQLKGFIVLRFTYYLIGQ
jgi:hypothetical protein